MAIFFAGVAKLADARDSKSRGSNTMSVRVRPPAPVGPLTMKPDCIFCAIIAGQAPAEIVTETDDILVVKDIAPKAPIHYLIIPKHHYKDIQSFSPTDCCLAGKMIKMAQRLSNEIEEAQDFRLVINNGYNAGQRIFHVHAHFLAGTVIAE